MPNIKHPYSDRVREVRPEQVPLYQSQGWTLVESVAAPAKKAAPKKAAAKKVAKKSTKG